MSIEVRVVKFAELEGASNFDMLAAEYAAEAGLLGMPKPKAHLETYRALDNAGVTVTLCAFLGGEIIGFLLITVGIIPHYSVPVAHLESFFVMKEHRKTGAGLRLLSAAEDAAKEKNAVGMMISAAVGGSLELILSKMSRYSKTHVGFFRRIE
jgi:GNAT superfamily N-acetyltransferase